MATKDISDKQVCAAVRESKARREQHKNRDNDWHTYKVLMEMTGQPYKVCWRALERADDRGLIEYGTSLSGAWLTPAGEDLLKGAA